MLYLKTPIHTAIPSCVEWSAVDTHIKNHYVAIDCDDKNALISYSKDDIARIPFEHYYHFFRLLHILKNCNKITEIISYGSIGSKQFNKNSDIDLFLVTDMNINDLLAIIKNTMPDSYIEYDSIKIWNGEILIECACISSLSDTVRYLPESPYVPAEKRIFLAGDFEKCVEQLKQITQIKPSKKELIEANKI